MSENSEYFVILSQLENDETPFWDKSAHFRGFGFSNIVIICFIQRDILLKSMPKYWSFRRRS